MTRRVESGSTNAAQRHSGQSRATVLAVYAKRREALKRDAECPLDEVDPENDGQQVHDDDTENGEEEARRVMQEREHCAARTPAQSNQQVEKSMVQVEMGEWAE